MPVARRAPGVVDEAAPDQPLLVRGSHKNLGDDVPRGFLTAVDNRPYPEPGLVRLHLADAITAPDNPLTARVAVNRVWRHLFGYGIVRTVDNLGRLGDPPSHPALLDHVARDFIDDGHSVKRLVRRLVLSRAYRMSSQASAAAAEVDPSNRLLRHANLRRLDAEAIRDAILSISGRLDPTMYGPSVPVHYAARRGLTQGDPDNGPVDGDGRRSIYQEIRRNAHNPFLEVFDLPKPATTPRPARYDERPGPVARAAQQPVRRRAGGRVGAAARRGRGGVGRRAHRPHVRQDARAAADRGGARSRGRLPDGSGGRAGREPIVAAP